MGNAVHLPTYIILITSTLRLATPLIFAALGALISEKSGVTNIAMDGIMAMGAFFGVLGSYLTKSPWLGLVFAMAAGALMALIHAYLSITLCADQIISGTAINVFAPALSTFLVFKFFGTPSQSSAVTALPYPSAAMRKIPVIGNFLGELNWMIFIAIGVVIIMTYVLYKTPIGLRIRAVGEHPRAADTLGINVYKIRYICVILSGVLGALGGATLSIAIMNLYRENMVSGRGFIAIAAMIFGNWKPVNSMFACILFAFADVMQMYAKGLGWAIPDEVYAAFPYIITMVVLVIFIGKTMSPAEDGVPYKKGER